jgi:hypothetical protein
MVVRLKSIAIWFGIVGFVLPVVIIAIDRTSIHGWWPRWVPYAFPSSYILGAASGVIDSFFYEMAAIAIAVNVVMYSIIGLALGAIVRGTQSARGAP